LECDKNNGKFFYPSKKEQANNFEADGTITNLAGLRATTNNILPCQDFQTNFPFVALLNSSSVGEKGYYLRFTPDSNEFGNLYNKIGILIQDEPKDQTAFAVFYYFITVLPVNDAPEIYLNSYDVNNPIQKAVQSAYQYNIETGITELSPINHIIDVDTNPNVQSMTVDIRFDNPHAVSVTCLNENGNLISILSGTPLRYTGSIFQVNETLKSLKVKAQESGLYEIKIYINDNGATGNCPPENGNPAINNGACPREASLTLQIDAAQNNAISGPLSIGASAGLGAFLIGGIVAGIVVARKLKNKKKDSWVEFDEENFKDYAGSNPLYEQRSRSQSNPIYVSRESLNLSE